MQAFEIHSKTSNWLLPTAVALGLVSEAAAFVGGCVRLSGRMSIETWMRFLWDLLRSVRLSGRTSIETGLGFSMNDSLEQQIIRSQGILFGKYRLIAKLAQGGMAELFLAQQEGLAGFSKKVAIKCILPHFAQKEDFITMFLDEARVAAYLNHPNVVHILDIGEVNGVFYMAMEYIPGQNLKEVHKQLYTHPIYKTDPPYALIASIFAQACAGLDHVHHAVDQHREPLQLVHRDISPNNLLLSYDGVLKVVDFGVAKARSQEYETEVGVLKGRLSYMSPEQLSAQPIDGRSDLFALGIVLYEMTTHKRLFRRRSEAETIQALLTNPIPPPTRICPGYPPGLEEVVLKSLKRKPEDRYGSAAEMQQALEEFVESTGKMLGVRQAASMLEELFPEERERERQGLYQHYVSQEDLYNLSRGSYRVIHSGDQHSMASIQIASPGAGTSAWQRVKQPAVQDIPVASLDSSDVLPAYPSESHHQTPTPSAGRSPTPHPQRMTPSTPPRAGTGSYGSARPTTPLTPAANQAASASLLGEEEATQISSPEEQIQAFSPPASDPYATAASVQGVVRERGQSGEHRVDATKGRQRPSHTLAYPGQPASAAVSPPTAPAAKPPQIQTESFGSEGFVSLAVEEAAPASPPSNPRTQAPPSLRPAAPPQEIAFSEEAPPPEKRGFPVVFVAFLVLGVLAGSVLAWALLFRQPTPKPFVAVLDEPTADAGAGASPIQIQVAPDDAGNIADAPPTTPQQTTTTTLQPRDLPPQKPPPDGTQKPPPNGTQTPPDDTQAKTPIPSRPRPRPRVVASTKTLPWSKAKITRKTDLVVYRKSGGSRIYTQAHPALCRKIEAEAARLLGKKYNIRGVTNPWKTFVKEKFAKGRKESYAFYPRAVVYVIYHDTLKGRSKADIAEKLVKYQKRYQFGKYQNR